MYTLDELALFNRCFFPQDAYDWMKAAGANDADAFVAMMYVKRHPQAGVLGLYQEYITDENFTKCINTMVNKFLGR